MILFFTRLISQCWIQQPLYNHHQISIILMNLLSNLLQYSNFQLSSQLMCLSPKAQIAVAKPVKQQRNMCSLQKQQQQSPEKRVVSKSLSKMNLFSGATINPKQRLLHRMVHKLEMKKRKYFYNFFVVLQNIKKNNVYRCTKELKATDKLKFKNGFSKIVQLEQILFSKYYEGLMKKIALRSIKKQGEERAALNQIQAIFRVVKLEQYFRAIANFAKSIEKQEIRLEILAASIKNIKLSFQKQKRLDGLAEGFNRIQSASLQGLLNYKQSLLHQFKDSYETAQQNNLVTSEQKQQIMNSFNNLEDPLPKLSNVKDSPIKKISQRSPVKQSKIIRLAIQQKQLKNIKYTNYLKAYSTRSQIQEAPLEQIAFRQIPFQTTKRCEPDPVCVNQISDLYDKNMIFYSDSFQNIKTANDACTPLISQSIVRSAYGDSFNQGFSVEDSHCSSHFTLLHPLRENIERQYKSNLQRSSVKPNPFGHQAINFKNSMVSERESMKSNEEQIRYNKNFVGMKTKNFIRNQNSYGKLFERKGLQPLVKVDFRYNSADNNCNYSKMKKEVNGMIGIPEHFMSFVITKEQNQAFKKKVSSQLGYYPKQFKSQSKNSVNTTRVGGVSVGKKINGSYLSLIKKHEY